MTFQPDTSAAFDAFARYTEANADTPGYADLSTAGRAAHMLSAMDSWGVRNPNIETYLRTLFEVGGGNAAGAALPEDALVKGLTSLAPPDIEGQTHESALNSLRRYRDDNSPDAVKARVGPALGILSDAISSRAVAEADAQQRKLEAGGFVSDAIARVAQGAGTGALGLVPLPANIRANATAAVNRFFAGDDPTRDGSALAQLEEGAGQLVPQLALAYMTAGLGSAAAGVAGARTALTEAAALAASTGEVLSAARLAELTAAVTRAETAAQVIGTGVSGAAFSNMVGGQAYDEVYARTGNSSAAFSAAFQAAPFGLLETLGGERIAALLHSTPAPGARGFLKAIGAGFLEEGLSTLPSDIGSDAAKARATGDDSYMKSPTDYLLSAGLEGVLGGVTAAGGHIVEAGQRRAQARGDQANAAARAAAQEATVQENMASESEVIRSNDAAWAAAAQAEMAARNEEEASRLRNQDAEVRNRESAQRAQYGLGSTVNAAGFEVVGEQLDHGVRAYDETSDSAHARIARDFETARAAGDTETMATLRRLAPLAAAQAHEDTQRVLIDDAKLLYAPGIEVTPEIEAARKNLRDAVAREGSPGAPQMGKVADTLRAAVASKDQATSVALMREAVQLLDAQNAKPSGAAEAILKLGAAQEFKLQKAAAKELLDVVTPKGKPGLILSLNAKLGELLAARPIASDGTTVVSPANAEKVSAIRIQLAEALKARDTYLDTSPSVRAAKAATSAAAAPVAQATPAGPPPPPRPPAAAPATQATPAAPAPPAPLVQPNAPTPVTADQLLDAAKNPLARELATPTAAAVAPVQPSAPTPVATVTPTDIPRMSDGTAFAVGAPVSVDGYLGRLNFKDGRWSLLSQRGEFSLPPESIVLPADPGALQHLPPTVSLTVKGTRAVRAQAKLTQAARLGLNKFPAAEHAAILKAIAGDGAAMRSLSPEAKRFVHGGVNVGLLPAELALATPVGEESPTLTAATREATSVAARFNEASRVSWAVVPRRVRAAITMALRGDAHAFNRLPHTPAIYRNFVTRELGNALPQDLGGPPRRQAAPQVSEVAAAPQVSEVAAAPQVSEVAAAPQVSEVAAAPQVSEPTVQEALDAYDAQAGERVQSSRLTPELLQEVTAALTGDRAAFDRLNKPETRFIARAIRDAVPAEIAKQLGIELDDTSKKYAAAEPQGPAGPDTMGTLVAPPTPVLASLVNATRVAFVNDIVVSGTRMDAFVDLPTGKIFLNARTVTTEAQALSRMGHEGLHLVLSRDGALMAEAVGLLERLPAAQVQQLRDELAAGYEAGVLDEEIAVAAAERIFAGDQRMRTAFGRFIARVVAAVKRLFGVDVSQDFAKIQAAGLFARGLDAAMQRDTGRGEAGTRFAQTRDTLKTFATDGPKSQVASEIEVREFAQALDRYVFRKDLAQVIGEQATLAERERASTIIDRYTTGAITAQDASAQLAAQTKRLTGAIYDHYFPDGPPAGVIADRLRTVPAALRSETDKLTQKKREAQVNNDRAQLVGRYTQAASALLQGDTLHPEVVAAVRAAYPVADAALLGGEVSAAEKDLADVLTLLRGEDQVPLLGDADLQNVVEALEQFGETRRLPNVGKALARAWAVGKAAEGVRLGSFRDSAGRFSRSILNFVTDGTALADALGRTEEQRVWIRSITQRFFDEIGNRFNQSANRFRQRVHDSVVAHFGSPVVPGDQDLRMHIASFVRQHDRGSIDPDGDLAVNVNKLRKSWTNANRAGVNGRMTGADAVAKEALLADLLDGITPGAPGSMAAVREKITQTWLQPHQVAFLQDMMNLFAELEPHTRHALESNTDSSFRPVDLYLPLQAFNGDPSLGGSGSDAPLFGKSSGAFAQASTGGEELPPELAPSLRDRKDGLRDGTIYYADSVVSAVMSGGKFALADITLARARNEVLALTDRSNVEGQPAPLAVQMEAILGQENSAGGAVIVNEIRKRMVQAANTATVSSRSLIPGESALMALAGTQAALALSSVRHVFAQPVQAFTSYLARHGNNAVSATQRLAAAARMMYAPSDSPAGKFRDAMFSGPMYQIANRTISHEGTVESSAYRDGFGDGIKLGDQVRSYVKRMINLVPGIPAGFADSLFGYLATANEWKTKIQGFALKKGDGYSAEMVALAELSFQFERANPGAAFSFEEPPQVQQRELLATSASLNTIIGPSDRATKGAYFQDSKPGIRIFRNLVSVFPTFNGTAASHARQAVLNMVARHRELGGSFADTVKDADFQENIRIFMAGIAGNLAFASASAGFTMLLGGAIAAMRGDDDNEQALLAAYAQRNKLKAAGNHQAAAALSDKIKALEARDVPSARLAQARSGEAFMVKIGQSLLSSVFILPAVTGGAGDVLGHIIVDGPRSVMFAADLEDAKARADAKEARAKKDGAHFARAEAQLERRRLDRMRMIEIGHTDGALGDGKTLFGSGTLAMGYTRIANALEPFWFDDPNKEAPLTPMSFVNALSAAGFGQADITTILNGFAAVDRVEDRTDKKAQTNKKAQ